MSAVTTEGWPEAPEPLPAPVVDNHCHLDTRVRGGALIPVEEALDRAAAVNVTRLVQVGCDVEGSRWAVDVAREHTGVVAAVAIHPNDAARSATLEEDLAAIDRLAADPVVRAVGETGLDHFRTGPEGRPVQEYAFRRHIDMARRHDRTLVIHDRDAHDDVLRVLDSEGVPDRVVMHCFSGDEEFARRCLDRGAYLSFSGTVTFKNAQYLRDALRIAPLDRILVETDAPFLTPTPHRGRPNASFLIPLTVRVMAEVRGIDLADLCHAIDGNTDAAFGGRWTPRVATVS